MSEQPKWRWLDPEGVHREVDSIVLHEALRSGRLAPLTPVWREGMTAFEPAECVPELVIWCKATPETLPVDRSPVGKIVSVTGAARDAMMQMMRNTKLSAATLSQEKNTYKSTLLPNNSPLTSRHNAQVSTSPTEFDSKEEKPQVVAMTGNFAASTNSTKLTNSTSKDDACTASPCNSSMNCSAKPHPTEQAALASECASEHANRLVSTDLSGSSATINPDSYGETGKASRGPMLTGVSRQEPVIHSAVAAIADASLAKNARGRGNGSKRVGLGVAAGVLAIVIGIVAVFVGRAVFRNNASESGSDATSGKTVKQDKQRHSDGSEHSGASIHSAMAEDADRWPETSQNMLAHGNDAYVDQEQVSETVSDRLSDAAADAVVDGKQEHSISSCKSTGIRKRLVIGASKDVPVETWSDETSSVFAIGFGGQKNTGIGFVLDPITFSTKRAYSKQADETLVRLVPVNEDNNVTFEADTSGPSSPVEQRLTVQRKPVSRLGTFKRALTIAVDADAIPSILWQLPQGHAVESMRAIAVQDNGLGVVFRSHNVVWMGWVDKENNPVGPLEKIAGTGLQVATPYVGYNGRDVLLTFADQPSENAPWTIRTALMRYGQKPLPSQSWSVPSGDTENVIISPTNVGFQDGRWMIVWTQGTAGSRQVRVQIVDAQLHALSNAFTVSPPGTDAIYGQGVLTSKGAAVVYLSMVRQSYEVWVAGISCK